MAMSYIASAIDSLSVATRNTSGWRLEVNAVNQLQMAATFDHCETLPQLMREAADAYGDTMAIRLEGRNQLTFREWDDRSADLPAALLQWA
jgi:hypothetical protein